MLVRDAYEKLQLHDSVGYDTFRQHCPTAHVVRRSIGQPVFTEGESAPLFAFVVDGRIKLVKRRHDRDSMLNLVDVGQLLCQSAPFADSPYCCTAIPTGGHARLLLIPRRELLALISDVPAATRLFLDSLARRTMRMCGRAAELSSGSVDQRLAALLLRLAFSIGTWEEAGVRVEIPLTRRDLSELCATSTETVIRRMRVLERSGVLQTHKWGFLLLQHQTLRNIAEGLTKLRPNRDSDRVLPDADLS